MRSVPVGLGELRVSRSEDEQLCVYGLGSCVAVYLYARGLVGLAHVVLPHKPASSGLGGELGRYADVAIPNLVADIERLGVGRGQLQATIAGGAAVLGFSSSIGDHNVIAVREELARFGIPVTQCDVGGERGRSVLFDARTQHLDVRVLATPVGAL